MDGEGNLEKYLGRGRVTVTTTTTTTTNKRRFGGMVGGIGVAIIIFLGTCYFERSQEFILCNFSYTMKTRYEPP